ncbi:MAG TPA: CocE/NonD family hydrolase [Solirubrobacteraceae bacterium]
MRRGVVLGVLVALLPAGDAAADEFPKSVAETNVPITMSDGVVLRARVTRPATADGKPAPGRFPVILTQTPYNKSVLTVGSGDVATLAGAPAVLVRNGYITMTVDVRGTGNSEGSWDSFGPREQRDAGEVIAWIGKQPWYDGRLGLYGASYMAINQFLTAAQDPPGLKAIFPIIPGGDLYRDVVWHGGSLDAGFIPLWLGLVSALSLLPADNLATDPAAAIKVLLQRVTTGTAFPLESAATLASGGDLAFDGDFYRVRSPETVVGKVRVPTFIVGGWWDLFQRGEPRLYHGLKLPPGQKQLLMGPWYHVTAGDGLGAPGAPPKTETLALRWFDRWIKGIDNDIEDFGPVTLYEIGSGRWQTQKRWPGPVAATRLYLREGKGLSADAPAKPSTDTIIANPLNGLCNRGTAQWTAGLLIPGQSCTEDQRNYEANGLTYTTQPLAQRTRIVGPLSLTLRGSTTARDTTWIATLTDVAPSGKSTPITSGWLMPSRRAVDEARSERAANGDLIVPFHPFTRASLQPVIPGEVQTLNVELFGTNAVFEPGHRIRVVLTHGDIPHLLSTIPDTLKQVGAVDRVHLDPATPSFLTYGEARAEAARCVSRRVFDLRLRAPRRGVRIRRATVTVGKRALRVRRTRSGLVTRVDLRGRPAGRVRVRIRIVGSNGRVYRSTRAFHTCGR